MLTDSSRDSPLLPSPHSLSLIYYIILLLHYDYYSSFHIEINYTFFKAIKRQKLIHLYVLIFLFHFNKIIYSPLLKINLKTFCRNIIGKSLLMYRSSKVQLNSPYYMSVYNVQMYLSASPDKRKLLTPLVKTNIHLDRQVYPIIFKIVNSLQLITTAS